MSNLYNCTGFLIRVEHCDKQFESIANKIESELHIHMNCAATQDHVGEAKRNNRTIKECFRCVSHSIPFTRMPPAVIEALAKCCTQGLNYIPPRNGVSSFYSPYMIMHGRMCDYERIKIPFGEYVQAYRQPEQTNSNEPRTLDGIYLHPLESMQVQHEVLHLATG